MAVTDEEPRSEKTHVVVLVGKPGTGKSRYAYDCARRDHGDSVYYKPRGEWWDGYDGQAAVVIDDYYGWLKYDELLKIMDRYPYRVPIKGGFRQFTSRIIYITSNVDIDRWYHFQGYDTAAIMRRVEDHYVDKVPRFNPVPADGVEWEDMSVEQQAEHTRAFDDLMLDYEPHITQY